MCEKEIMADYITIQAVETNSILVLTEIETITKKDCKFIPNILSFFMSIITKSTRNINEMLKFFAFISHTN